MKNLKLYFAIIMMALIGLFLLLLFFPYSNMLLSQKSVIFRGGVDWFADFFNVMRYMSDDAGFYFSKINESDGHSGFPIGKALYYPFTQLVDYSKMSLHDCWASKSAVFSCVSCLTVLVFFFWDSLNRLCQKYNVGKYILVLFLFSSVFIFSLERANFIFFTATLINYFLVYYDNESKGLRRFSLVCLCLAATLKGYPVFFGLLLLKEKRYKEIAFCVIFTLLIAFLPFAFMERGFENLPKMIENTGLNNKAYLHNYMYLFGLHKLTCLVSSFLHLPAETKDLIVSGTRVVEALFVLLSFILVLVEERFYRQCLLIVCCVLLLPINSGFYCGLYLFPVIIIFFHEREITKLDYLLMVLLCMVLNPLQVTVRGLTITPLLSNTSLIIMWMILIVSTLPRLKTFRIKQLL